MNRKLPPRLAFLVPAIATAVLFVACGSDDEGPVAVPPTIAPTTPEATSPAPTQPSATVPVPQTPLPPATPPPSGGPSGEIDATDLAQLSQVATMPSAGEPFHTTVWRSDGQGVFVAAADNVSFLALSGQSEKLTTLQAGETLLDISSSGLLALTTDRLSISLRAAAGSVSPVQIPVPEHVSSAQFSPDATFLAVTISDRIAAQLYDTKTGELVREVTGFETAAPVYSVQIGPDGREIIWQARATAEVQDLVSNQATAPVQTEDFIADLALKPDRTELVTASADTLTFWDLEAGEAIDTLKLGPLVHAVSYTPSGNMLAVGVQGAVRFIEKAKPLTDSLDVDAADVVFSPTGNALAVVARDFSVSLWLPRA